MQAIQADIQHTEATLRQMFRVAGRTYGTLRIILQAALGATVAVVGACAPLGLALQGLLMLVGCWLFVSPDLPADWKTGQAVRGYGGALPRLSYTFGAQEFLVTQLGQETRAGYDQLQRLVEDDRYLYLFLEENSICMVDRLALKGGTSRELKELLAQKTGLSWRRDRGMGLLSVNIYDLKQALQDRRKG